MVMRGGSLQSAPGCTRDPAGGDVAAAPAAGEPRGRTGRSRAPPFASLGGFRGRLLPVIVFTILRSGSPFLTTALQRIKPCRPPARCLLSMNMEQAAWPRAIVMSEDGAEKMNIAIPFLGKTRNLNRPKDEPLSKVMVRIRQSAMPPPPKGGKKARSKGFVPGAAPAEEVSAPPPAEVEIECLLECSVDGVVSEDTLNQDAWVHGRTLRVGASRFLVHVNPPVIEDLRIPRRPLAGIPQRPAISLRFAEASECRWQWFRARPQAGQAPSEEQDRWERIEDGGGDAMVYTPGERDVGKQLKLECTPRRMAGPGAALEVSGDVASAVTDSEVVPGPAKSAGEGRHALAAGRDVGKSGVRVMSYNLLASAYADTEVARTQLFGTPPPLRGRSDPASASSHPSRLPLTLCTPLGDLDIRQHPRWRMVTRRA